MRKLIKLFSEYISKTGGFNEIEAQQIEYSMRILTFESLKIIIILGLFSLMGYKIEAIIAILVMVTTKPFIGGYHEDTQLKCFIATLSIVASVIYLSINIKLDFTSMIILNVASFYCFWHQAPVVNFKMPLTKEKLIKKNRIFGLSITFIYSVIAVLLYKYTIVSILITWMLVFQALLMFNKK